MWNGWRTRGLALLATLFLPGCWQHKEAFEKAPLAPGQIEVVRLSERANLAVERIRFWSKEMNEPRFFLALVPKTQVAPSEVFILNHGWRDRPEDLLKHLKVDQVYDEMLGRREVRPAIVVLPDVRFSSFYREYSDRFPFPNYLNSCGGRGSGNGLTPLCDPFRAPALGDWRILLRRLPVAGCGTALCRAFRQRERDQRTRRSAMELLASATAAVRPARFSRPGQVYDRGSRPGSQTLPRLRNG